MPTIQLRHGQLTRSPKLDRTIFFDPKSRDYPITAVLAENSPRSYTWGLDLRLDQGEEGACVSFALNHELAATNKKVKGVTNQQAFEWYKEMQGVDEWEGENYSGTSVLAGAKVITSRGYYKEYRWAFGIDQALLAISRKGPCVAGLNWYSGMFDTDENGFIHASGSWQGGHAIIVRGVNLKKEYVLLTNSWGGNWGQGGNCKLSFYDFDKLLKEQGELMVPIRTSKGVK